MLLSPSKHSRRWPAFRAVALLLLLAPVVHAEALADAGIAAVDAVDAGTVPAEMGLLAPSADGGVPAAAVTSPVPPATTAPATPEGKTLALLKLDANKPAADQAQAVSALLATRLSDAQGLKVVSQSDVATMLGFEKQRQLLGSDSCSEQCMVELSGAVGARYVGAGRIDQFGAEYVLTFSIFDARKGVPVVKTSARAPNDAGLPGAADEVAHAAWKALGVSPPEPSATELTQATDRARAERSGVELTFKAGSNFISSIRTLSPTGHLEVAYRFAPEWEALLEISIALVRTDAGGGSGISVVPSILGVRKLYFVQNPVQPYWGLGLGVQLSFGTFGIFTSTGALPTIFGLGGVRWMFASNMGVLLELSTNLASATLGLATGGTGAALTLDGTLGFLYRF